LVQDKQRVVVMLASRLRPPSAAGRGPEGVIHDLGDAVVIKATDRRYIGSGYRTLEDPYREIAALRELGAAGGHRNVLPLLDALEDDGYIYTVLPYVPGGDLYYRVRASPQPFVTEDTRGIFVDMCKGLRFMKLQGFAHR
jgi:serine/threonine protein kinase